MRVKRIWCLTALVVLGANAAAQNKETVESVPDSRKVTITLDANELSLGTQQVTFHFFKSADDTNPVEVVRSATFDDQGKASIAFYNHGDPAIEPLFALNTVYYQTKINGRNWSPKHSLSLMVPAGSTVTVPVQRGGGSVSQTYEDTRGIVGAQRTFQDPYQYAEPGKPLIVFDFTKNPEKPEITLNKGAHALKLLKGYSEVGPEDQPLKLAPGRRIRVNVIVADPNASPPTVTLTKVLSAGATPSAFRLVPGKLHGGDGPTGPWEYDRVNSDPHLNGIRPAVKTAVGYAEPVYYYSYEGVEDLTVPSTGTMKIVASFPPPPTTQKPEEDKGSTVAIAPADTYRMDNAFSTQIVWEHLKHPLFALSTPVYTFGDNGNLRIDVVGLFKVGSTQTSGSTTTSSGGAALGQAISYNNYIGSPYKESGRHWFGFPLRYSLTLGMTDLSFSDHRLGGGGYFLGFGISIPVGQQKN